MKLECKNSVDYYISCKSDFKGIFIDKSVLVTCFDFACNVVFGDGHHRKHRSGGQYSRKNGELFANTFQGKLAEFVTYQEFVKNGFSGLKKPDLGVYGKGIWDDADLEYRGKKINIKSAAFFSNLLLLEAKDWNSDGEYIPNLENSSCQDYDFFLLVRIKPDLKNRLRKQKLFYTNEIDLDLLKEMILGEQWSFDFAGVCSQQTIKYIIRENYLLPQNSLLNGKIKMDADNYYIQCGELKDFDFLVRELQKF
ncbi:hypothetical protein BZG02_00560 [Labilibaculum filiforme]|uniref:Restriction endonuclease n=1 Tax=Labilibaculum filiforme TaxID=1940526 RepID=A0A2N3I5F6_9BACT|nr:hypothetical protein [Labilibaculum filiforme]PKQ65532.1 hypothetical protein BZG02_00560 [Labilibaculum filiforme]